MSLYKELLPFQNFDVCQNCVQICNQWVRIYLAINTFKQVEKDFPFWTGLKVKDDTVLWVMTPYSLVEMYKGDTYSY